MMKHKKIVTLALATALTATLFTPAFSDSTAGVTSPAVPLADSTQEEQIMNFDHTMGTVQEVNTEAKYILVKNEQMQMEIRFNLDEATWLMDGESGTPLTMEELKGKEVIVSHSLAMTRSLPPQSYAYAVITKGTNTPNYAVIEEVANGDNGSVRLTTDSGSMWVTVSKDADIKPFKTKNIVTKEDLQPGAQVVLYYDIVALSYPGQAQTNRVVLLQLAAAEENKSDAAETQMVNLRETANRLGMQLEWIADGQTVILSKDAFTATVVIGSTDYGINRMRVKEQMPAEIRDGRTYVPQSFIDAVEDALK